MVDAFHFENDFFTGYLWTLLMSLNGMLGTFYVPNIPVRDIKISPS